MLLQGKTNDFLIVYSDTVSSLATSHSYQELHNYHHCYAMHFACKREPFISLQPLMEAGLDSLGAVELRNSLATHFAVDLPSTVTFDYPTIAALANFIASSQLPISNTSGLNTVSHRSNVAFPNIFFSGPFSDCDSEVCWVAHLQDALSY